jgi:Arc/MetJ-type ribon-helix-helix transcriptional regulator
MKNKKGEQPRNMKLVTVLLPEANLEGLDELVRRGMYQNRSAAIRSAVRDLVKQELWGSKNQGKTNTGNHDRSK